MIHWSARRSDCVIRGGCCYYYSLSTQVTHLGKNLPDFRGSGLGLRLVRRCL